MTFSLREIPLEPLKRLGITRRQLEKLPSETLSALLSGMRTRLMRFTSVRLDESPFTAALDARLSLFRKGDGSVGLRFHPIRIEPDNRFGLSGEEQKLLQADPGATVHKTLGGKGGNRSVEVGYDPVTRSYVTTAGEGGRQGTSLQSDGSPSGQRRDDKREGKVPDRGEVPRQGAEREGQKEAQGRKLSFSHSRVEDIDLLLDVGLLASGLGTVILLEHLADLALHTRIVKKPMPLYDRSVRDMLASVYAPTRSPRITSRSDDMGQKLRELLKGGRTPEKTECMAHGREQGSEKTEVRRESREGKLSRRV